MGRLLDVLKALTLVVAIAVGASIFVLLLQVSSAVKRLDSQVASTTGQLNVAIAQVRNTAELSGKLVDDARLSVDNLNQAAIDERFYFEKQLPSLMNQAHGILANVETATADLHPLLTETEARTRALAPIEQSAVQLVADADTTVKDPHIAASLDNLQASTADLAVTAKESSATMASVQAMAKDGQDEVYKLTHPKPLVTIADWTLKVLHAIGGFF
jgi:conjugal transfer/entry exclusion protein